VSGNAISRRHTDDLVSRECETGETRFWVKISLVNELRKSDETK
jgi:hypothetical protein